MADYIGISKPLVVAGVTPKPEINYFYGPWRSINEALNNIPQLARIKGLTVGIIEGSEIVEYWFKDGVDLVLKSVDPKLVYTTYETQQIINDLKNTYVQKKIGKELIPSISLTKLNQLPTKENNDNTYVAKEEGKSLIEDAKIAKLDALPSSVFSQAETQQAINTAIEGINSAGQRVSFLKEYKNGTLEYIGENGVIMQDIYSKMIELAELPTIENDSKSYIITDEPIGNNLYLVIDNVTISTGVNVFSSINNNHYKFEIIQETDNSLPKLKCTCLVANTKGFTAKIKLSYIKYFGEKVSFSIECASEAEANSLELSIPKLKFNKEAVISLTADDASASHYCALFNYISNRRYCLDYFFHHNQYEANDLPYADATHVGTLPALGKTLGFTDGCGVERRMTFDCAIWPNAIASGEPMMDRIQPIDPNASNQYRFLLPYLLWGDLEPMLEFGCSISQHNVNTPKPETPEGILNGYIADNAKALTKLGRGFKILTRPDGNNTYTNVSLDFPQHLAIIGENAPTVFQYPFSADFDMYKILQQRRFPSKSTDYITEVIEAEMLLPKEQRRWMHSGIHRAGQTTLDYVLWLNDNLGKDGSDVAWITTPDEFYEYWYMRKYSKVIKSVVGNTANFDVYIPKGQYFYYPELTFMTNQAISGVSNIHDKIKGFSFNGTNMFNVNLDNNLVSLAEKYTARFEANQLPIDKQDALYFTNQLRADLKISFLLRIDAVENVPLESLSISGGNVTDLLIGETTQLTAVFTPAGTAQTNIEWSVNDKEIATVDSNGLVTCVGAGELRVYVQSLDNPTIHAEKDILCVASRPITGIVISGENNGIINDTIQLTANLTPSNTTETGILWETDNNTIAEVTQSGLVTLKSVGTVKITATSLSNELIYGQLLITVAAEAIPIESITVNGTTPIEVGNTEQFSVTYNPNNTTEVGVVWASSNQNVATVNSSGIVTAVSAGTAIITATSIHKPIITGTKGITITPQVVAVTGLTITGGNSVNSGNTLQLGISYTPSNTTQQGVTWSSSDETKATVNSSGLVTAIADGSVVITATSTINGAISDTHNITVNAVVQTYPEVNIMGQDSLLGFKEIYEGKVYQVCNTVGAENTSQTKTLYDTNTDTILQGWSIMDSTQKIAAFGSTGNDFLNVNNTNYNGVSYLRTYRYAGAYQAIRNCYYGFNVPNGTYRVTILQSVTNRTDANWGPLPNMGQLLINNTAYPMPNVHPYNNTQWGDSQDYVITDGKLLFKFITNSGKYFGFSCINIKKIA